MITYQSAGFTLKTNAKDIAVAAVLGNEVSLRFNLNTCELTFSPADREGVGNLIVCVWGYFLHRAPRPKWLGVPTTETKPKFYRWMKGQ
jgi:hypothetical protein